jgi:hypothetical protein
MMVTDHSPSRVVTVRRVHVFYVIIALLDQALQRHRDLHVPFDFPHYSYKSSNMSSSISSPKSSSALLIGIEVAASISTNLAFQSTNCDMSKSDI